MTGERRIEPARVRVRFADTDAMRVVYYGTYMAFLEAGRVEALRQVDAEYGTLMERGVHSPVLEAHVQYHQPARFDDVLLVHARARAVGKVRFEFMYEVRREADDALIASATTLHACVDAATLRPVRIPAWVRLALEQLAPE